MPSASPTRLARPSRKAGEGIDAGATELVHRTTRHLLGLLEGLAVGGRCPVEQEVATHCRVSRTTVRTAYASLEKAGVLERRGSGRFLKRPADRGDLVESPCGTLTKEERVAKALLRRIGEGTIEPGQRISERTLATELGCSLAPVREALLSLAPLGIFRKEKRRQWEAVRLTSRQCLELTEYRKVMEGYCLRKLFEENMGLLQRASFERILIDSKKLLQHDPIEREAFLAVDVAFHTCLLESSGNRLLAERTAFVYALIDFQFGVQNFSLERARFGIVQHVEILEAILANDKRRAERVLLEHLDGACENLLRLAKTPHTQ